MAMQIGAPGGAQDEPEVILDINTTPLIDVMLVLLIMLIITIPIQLHAVNLNLPQARPQPPQAPPEVVRIDVDAASTVHWNGLPLAGSAELEARLQAAAAQPVTPEIHLRPDANARYAVVAGVMAATQRARLDKFGIVGSEQFLNPAVPR